MNERAYQGLRPNMGPPLNDTAIERRTPQVTELIEKHDNLLSENTSLLAELKNRLATVSRSEPRDPTAKEPLEPNATSVIDKLAGHNRWLQSNNAAVQELLRLLEV